MINELKGSKIVGIKKAPSADGSRTYTIYYCNCPYSDYELGQQDKISLEGCSVEEYQTTEDFPLSIGDVVSFFYGKAIQGKSGLYQPIIDYKLIEKATPFDKPDKPGK